MKKFIFLILLGVVLFACSDERTLPVVNFDPELSLRQDPCEWCDGGECSSPSYFVIYNPDQPNDSCCFDFFTCANKQITLHTTHYNFDTELGLNQGVVYRDSSDASGWGSICFLPIGSHFLIEFECFGSHRCLVFENAEGCEE